ncbi:DUF1236 domain-containing protein [Roseiarcaceae bacterium H3SJ34-1]|uniref:DUF1236 domain-containing protein n=1 Tax=Terripilifer ovatus TaxID=3032367 RepID=UPI003AB964C1|nr:DUF1236 domain-containing protein [Roseiarcaceae bacterium H3SJ34-1]
MIKAISLGTLLSIAVLSGGAYAQSSRDGAAAGGALSGAAAGAAGGAVVGGPVGAVVGGVAGAAVGSTAGAALTPDDRTYIRGYVTERRVDPVVIHEPLAVGRPLPRQVRTYTIEGDPRYNAYRYARVNNQYLLVDANGNVIGSLD